MVISQSVKLHCTILCTCFSHIHSCLGLQYTDIPSEFPCKQKKKLPLSSLHVLYCSLSLSCFFIGFCSLCNAVVLLPQNNVLFYVVFCEEAPPCSFSFLTCDFAVFCFLPSKNRIYLAPFPSFSLSLSGFPMHLMVAEGNRGLTLPFSSPPPLSVPAAVQPFSSLLFHSFTNRGIMFYFQLVIMAGMVLLAYYFEFTDTFPVHIQGFFCYDKSFSKPYPGPDDTSKIPPVLIYSLITAIPTITVRTGSHLYIIM